MTVDITTAIPTVKGWYWFRDEPDERWRMVEVYFGRAYAPWLNQSLPIEVMRGEWAGPIAEPGKEA